MKVFDFLCRKCKTIHEEWVDNAARYGDAGEACPMCDGVTEAVPVPPKPKVATAAPSFDRVARGAEPERPGPGTFDTRAIADRKIGEPQWKEQRSKMWRDRERAAALGHRDKMTFRR